MADRHGQPLRRNRAAFLHSGALAARSPCPAPGRARGSGWSAGAGGAVDGEAGGASVAAGPAALEAVLDAGACRDGGVVAGVGEGRVRAGLGEAAVEVAGDLLVAREGEG